MKMIEWMSMRCITSASPQGATPFLLASLCFFSSASVRYSALPMAFLPSRDNIGQVGSSNKLNFSGGASLTGPLPDFTLPLSRFRASSICSLRSSFSLSRLVSSSSCCFCSSSLTRFTLSWFQTCHDLLMKSKR